MPAALWMWEHHVLVVADKALEIATHELANIEKSVSAALLHDIADTQVLRNDVTHEQKSQALAKNILVRGGFTETEAEEIVTTIIAPHSCYPENMPQTLEAKVVATADAFGHLGTDFYSQVNPEKLSQFGLNMSQEQYRQWVLKKIERDFKNKIFFEKIKSELQPSYDAIKARFNE